MLLLEPGVFGSVLNQLGQVEDKSLNSKLGKTSLRQGVSILMYTLYQKLANEVSEKINTKLSQNSMPLSLNSTPLSQKKSVPLSHNSTPSRNNSASSLIILTLVDSPPTLNLEPLNSFDALQVNYLNERLLLNFTENLSKAEKVD